MRAVRSGYEDGVEWVEEEDAMIHLVAEGSQCPQCPQCLKEFKSAKGQNGMTAYGIVSIDIIGVIVD